MRDAALERLAKLISDEPSPQHGGKWYQPMHVNLRPEEGWFSLFLVALVVYSTIWSIQSAGWVDDLNVLSLTTLLGLIWGVLAAKQQRFAPWKVHIAAVVFCGLLAFWQAAGAYDQGSMAALSDGLHRWYISVVLNGGTSNDDSIFLLLILALGFLLPYVSAWLVYRARIPWLMVLANAIVLLINLDNLVASYVIYLVIFLIAALLLLVRFNLFVAVKRWRKQGLRYEDDIGWDFMQAGALISIGILILSWLLPAGYENAPLSQIWNLNANPWMQVQNTWNRVIALNGGYTAANHGNFRNTLVLAGNPNLNQDVVFVVRTDGDGSQYLAFLSYDTYTPQGWEVSTTDRFPIKANQAIVDQDIDTHPETQHITVVNPPGEQYAYLGGASAIISLSVPATVLSSSANGDIVAWVAQNSVIAAGSTYSVVSAVSSADTQTLRSVPMPADAPPPPPPSIDEPAAPDVYNQNVLNAYLQLPKGLDPRISALAQKITSSAPTMYDKAVALESYLRTHYTYDLNVQKPAEAEGVSWFLFGGDHRGFCNYFASAMAVMARSVGIPARVVAGYTHGTYDANRRQWVVRGNDAHAWTQIYFAGYGWINFEPSQSFSTFSRPQPGQFAASITGPVGSVSSGETGITLPSRRHIGDPADLGGGEGNTAATTGMQAQRLRQDVGITLGSLILFVLCVCLLFALWWRRLFRRYGLPTQLYGRLCMLANWAGVKMQLSQTPYEYLHTLALSTPDDAAMLERLGDIYVRNQWADPQSEEHPQRTGEIDELPQIWRKLQPHLFSYLIKHPHFLRTLPERALHWLRKVKRWHRERKRSIDEI
jgi:transglutaminase-like putative cysteine protease